MNLWWHENCILNVIDPKTICLLEWGGKKQHCQAKPQFVGCDCAIHLCNHTFLKVALSLLAKEFEAEPVYIYNNLYYLTKQ